MPTVIDGNFWQQIPVIWHLKKVPSLIRCFLFFDSIWSIIRDIQIHIECPKQIKLNLYFYVSGQSGPFYAVKEITQDLNHDLTFSAHTINCVCHSIRSMFRVLGIYNFAPELKKSTTHLTILHSVAELMRQMTRKMACFFRHLGNEVSRNENDNSHFRSHLLLLSSYSWMISTKIACFDRSLSQTSYG